MVTQIDIEIVIKVASLCAYGTSVLEATVNVEKGIVGSNVSIEQYKWLRRPFVSHLFQKLLQMEEGLVDVGISVGKETSSHISRAIVGFDASGPGALTNFRVNNKIVKKKLSFKKRIRLERGIGLTCDGKLIKAITKDDTWSIDTRNAATCFNMVDRDLAYKLWSEDNPDRPIEEMPTT